MSKMPTRATAAGSTLPGATLKTLLLAIIDALNSTGLQEGTRSTITSSGTLAITQAGLVLVDCSGGNVTLTLPASGATADDATYYFRRIDSTTNTLTVQRNGTDTIEGSATGKVIPANGVLELQLPAGATNWRVLNISGPTPFDVLANLGLNTLATTGTAPTYAVTVGPAFTLQGKAQLRLQFNASNGGAASTLAVNGGAATGIKQYDATGTKIDPAIIASQISDVEYDGTHFVILNPLPSSIKVQTIPTPTFSAGAMTIPAAAYTLDFRSSTLGSGAVTTVSATAAALVVPSGATLGLVSAQQSDLYLLQLFPSAGVIEYAIVNAAGGVDLSETGVISTTAISAGSTSASTVYSTTARTNVPYRVIGLLRSTQTTAGTWAQSMSLIQGQGGNALTAMMSLGYGQSWQTFTLGTQRVLGTTYYNTTGKPIQLALLSNASAGFGITINGTLLLGSVNAGGAYLIEAFPVVPVGASYVVTGAQSWAELR